MCGGAVQLFRSAMSVAANDVEACARVGCRFRTQLKVARKELKETRVWLMFAEKLLRNPFIEEIEAETVEGARMMGASMRKRGYSGWMSP
ncbi:MAG: four helix bundle protein [Kiritimatiellia bacterium]